MLLGECAPCAQRPGGPQPFCTRAEGRSTPEPERRGGIIIIPMVPIHMLIEQCCTNANAGMVQGLDH